MSKAKFLAVRELIQEQHYDAARVVLNTIDHPLAAEWLAKLDRLAPQKPAQVERAAASPEPAAVSPASAAVIDSILYSTDPTEQDDSLTPAPDAAVYNPPKPPTAQETPPKTSLDVGPALAPTVKPAAGRAVSPQHAAFMRPGTVIAAVDEPASGPPRDGAPRREPTAREKARASRVLDVDQPRAPSWMSRIGQVVLGTPDGKSAAKVAAPRPNADEDELPDWAYLTDPAAAHGGDMPWLSGKVSNGSTYRPAPAVPGRSVAPAGESMEWEFTAEVPLSTPQPDLDFLTGDFDMPESVEPKQGPRLFDGLNLIIVGIFCFVVFAFMYMAKQSSSGDEGYTLGIEIIFIFSGGLAVLLGLWNIVKPR